jgi:sugar phosphate permease
VSVHADRGVLRMSTGEAKISTAKPTRFRWWILVLFSLLYLISYIDRGITSVVQPEIARDLGINKTDMGLILAAFSWAYAAGQVPVGWLGDRFGPKRILSIIIVAISAAVALTGAAVSYTTLLLSRLFLGMGESGAFPVASRGMQMWFHRTERGRIQGTTHFFSRLAVAGTPAVAVIIVLAWGWRAVFFVAGALGLLWGIAFVLVYRNTPEEHPRVNDAELAQIRGTNPDGTITPLRATQTRVPWGRIFRSRNMWYIGLGYCCFFFGTNFYLTWYPTYLREYRGLTLAELGLIGSVPLIGGMLGDVVGGTLTDLLFKRTGNARLARRAVAAPGFLLAALFVMPAAMTDNASISVLCLALSFFFLEFVIGPAWAVPMDVGGQFSGTVTAIMNMAGAFAASLTPLVYGSLFDRGYWIAPFFVSAAVLAMGALVWVFLIDPEKSVVD